MPHATRMTLVWAVPALVFLVLSFWFDDHPRARSACAVLFALFAGAVCGALSAHPPGKV